MKEKLQLTKSIISVVFIAILLVFALFVEFGSFAWFATLSNVSTKGPLINAYNEDTIVSVRFFRVTDHAIQTDSNGVKHTVYMFGFNQEVLKTQDITNSTTQERTDFETPIDMRPYSQLSSDCQILIEVTLEKSGKQNLAVSTSTRDFLGNVVASKKDAGTYDFVPNGLPLSSVFRFAIFNSIEKDETSFIIDESVISANQKSFISHNDSTNVFSFNNAITTTPIEITPTDNKFYIFLDYNSLLVEYLNEQVIHYVDSAEYATDGEFDTIILGETNLSFVPDFEFIVTGGVA